MRITAMMYGISLSGSGAAGRLTVAGEVKSLE